VDIQKQQIRMRLADLLRERPNFVNGHEELEGVGNVAVRGICGTWVDVMEHLGNGKSELKSTKLKQTVNGNKVFLWLGSSYGNLTLPDATKFLQQIFNLQPGDKLLVGNDRCRDADKVKAAYSQDAKCWETFILNGVKNAGQILGGDDAASKLDGGSGWEYVSRWDAAEGRHCVSLNFLS
jgi:uncharacterized SAM-dependent methyltransferase